MSVLTFRSLVLASNNQGKISEFRKLLSHLPLKIIGKPKEIDVAETGVTFIENARLKAIEVAEFTGQWALADDSGLCVDALGGAPGVHSARYASHDEGRINRLLEELKSAEKRTAYFSSAICIAGPGRRILLEVEAQCMGNITHSPRGKNGFGYDPIFEVGGVGYTFAEMSIDQKKLFSHRGKAFSLLEPRLKILLESTDQ